MKTNKIKKIQYIILISLLTLFLTKLSFCNESPGDGEDSKDNCEANFDGTSSGLSSTCNDCEEDEEEEKDDNDANDPVSMIGGKLNIPVFDMEFHGNGKNSGIAYLYIRRSFSSQTSVLGAFGYNWSSNLDIVLTENWIDLTTSLNASDYNVYESRWLTGVSIRTETGSLIYFRYDKNKNAFVSPACEDSILYKTLEGYTWVKKFGTKYNFENPVNKISDDTNSAIPVSRYRLQSISDKYNNKIVFEYDNDVYEDHLSTPLGINKSQLYRQYLPKKIVEESTGRYIEINWKDYSEDFSELNTNIGWNTIKHFVSSIKDCTGRETKYAYKYYKGFIGLTLHSVTDFEGNKQTYEFLMDPSEITYDKYKYSEKYIFRTLEVTNKRNAKTTYIFNKNNVTYDEVWSSVDPGNSSVKVTKVIDALGYYANFHFDPNLSASILTDKRGNKSAYFYSHGRINTILKSNGKKESFEYDSAYNKISEGHGSAYTKKTYDANHNLTNKIDEMGNQTNYEYDAKSNLWTKKSDSSGNEWKREIFDGIVKAEISPDGSRTEYEYDEWGNKSAIIDGMGKRKEYIYDNAGNLIKLIEDTGKEINYIYDEIGNKIVEIDANGNRTKYQYDGYGNVIEIVYPDKSSKKFAYDENSNLIKETDSLGRETKYEYNILDQLISIKYPDGSYVENKYDEMGNITHEKTKNGTKQYYYDSMNRKIKTIDEADNEINYIYDDNDSCGSCSDNGQISRIIDQNGNITSYDYDIMGRLIKTTNADNTYSEIKYDVHGNAIEKIDENGHSTYNIYDNVNRLISIRNTLNESIEYTYDLNGNRKTVKDPKGNITRYNYDNSNNLIEIIDTNGGIITFTYDKNNNMTSLKDPNSNTTKFEYDSRNRIIKTIDPLGNESKTEYDTEGNVIATIDAKGQRIEFDYDVMNRLIKKRILATDTSPYSEITYLYDTNGNLLEVNDEIGKTKYQYDNLNRPIKVIYPVPDFMTSSNIASDGFTVSYEYDIKGNRTKMIYPSGKIINYTYNSMERLSNINLSDTGDFIFNYDNAGRRKKLTYPNGIITTYDYDDANRLKSLQSTVNSSQFLNIQYTHDLNGNRTTRQSLAGTQSYTYDKLNQVIKAVYENGDTEEFIYDKNGNRIQHKSSEFSVPSVANSTFNNLNQLLKREIEGVNNTQNGTTKIEGRVVDKNIATVHVNGILAEIKGESYTVNELPLTTGENTITVVATDKAGNSNTKSFKIYFDAKAQSTYQYDKNGNLIQKSEKGVITSYKWDAENRLVRVTTNDTNKIIEYGYFDNGNRAWKSVNNQKTYYLHDGNEVIAEYNGTGELLKEYVYSDEIDEILNVKEGVNQYYPLQDGLNSVITIINSTGTIVQNYNYETFGAIKESTGELGNAITYTGRWLESETGDYFYRARYYDAGTGRFLSIDPIELESGDYNFYRYVGNGVANANDPLGLKRVQNCCLAGIIDRPLENKNFQTLLTFLYNHVSDEFSHHYFFMQLSTGRTVAYGFSPLNSASLLEIFKGHSVAGYIHKENNFFGGKVIDKKYVDCDKTDALEKVIDRKIGIVYFNSYAVYQNQCKSWARKQYNLLDR